MRITSGKWRHPLHSILLTGLLLNPVSGLAAGEQQQWNIPAQPLDVTLGQVALQAGVNIGAKSEWLAGLQAPALKGQMSLEEVLARILADTGLHYEMASEQNVVLRLPVPRVDEEKTIILGQSHLPYSGYTLLNDQQLRSTPAGNGNLTDLLERVPAIESQGVSRSSQGAGELKPENISINGARFFQNAFVVDGISINNDLDPGYSAATSFDRIGSHSQGLYVDTNAIASVRVNDHNISASAGKFTGGTVEVDTKSYAGEDSFGVSWRHTSDSLTRYHYDEEQAEAFENGELGWFQATNNVQPRFKKNFYNLYGSFGHGKDWGSFLTLSRSRSTIPFLNSSTRSYQVDPDGTLHAGEALAAGDINQYRQNENLTLKTSWTPSEHERLDIRMLYGTGESVHQLGAVPDSEFTNNHHSLSLGLGYQNMTALGQYSVDFDVTRMGDKRDSDNEYYAVISGLHSVRAEASGGPYALDNTQTSTTLKPAFRFNSQTFLGAEHHIAMGADITHKQMETVRPDTTLSHTFMCFTGACTPDTLNYFSKAYNHAYQLDIDQNEYAFWLEDDIRAGRLQVRPGVRVDYNSFLENTDIAPRLAVNWDLFGDRKTRLEAGFNRYYGRSFMELQAKGIRDASLTTVLNPGKPFETEIKGSTDWRTLMGLKTPYDEERVLGISHATEDFRFSLTGVNRKGRDQINSHYDRALGETYYTNDASSDTDILTLEVASTNNLPFAGAWWGIHGSLKWMDRTSNQLYESYGNNAVYDGSLGGGYQVDRTDKVVYDGQVIDRGELPVNAFGTPLKAQLSISTLWPEHHLTMNNFFTWKDEYEHLRKLSAVATDPASGDRLHAFVKESYDQSYTWDMQLRWEPRFNDMSPYVQFDVLNVLDDQNVASAGSSGILYDIGRQYWLELGVHF
ncbi:TonB-dependent receptor plug domain-containing protein [Marinobacterium marinum]|uniref:TonB-dependent receptor plug domain-containing protein n=1 Tax=Marinobacterium marinum TaxID=2756129 RepID=A0A7W1WWY3_9GAMM|nr:secretin and TonB N-terminal domain-containing protein [Marinobacterium marinum]MBA4501755.1 TonB-dependent receptor plug domain-containing protein [Marinobacterium marinum]